MTVRINSTAQTLTSDVFQPTGDFSVQAKIDPTSKAYVDIEGQVDADAPWVALGSLSVNSSPPVLRFAKCPNVRIRMYNNNGGSNVTVWSGE